MQPSPAPSPLVPLNSLPPEITIPSLQAYIAQLATYINENNTKYVKNMKALQDYYTSVIQGLNSSLEAEKSKAATAQAARISLERKAFELSSTLKDSEQAIIALNEKLVAKAAQIDELYSRIQLMQQQQIQSDLVFRKHAESIEAERNAISHTVKEQQLQLQVYREKLTFFEELQGSGLEGKYNQLRMTNAALEATVAQLKERVRDAEQIRGQQLVKIAQVEAQISILRQQPVKAQVVHDEEQKRLKDKLEQQNSRIQMENTKLLTKLEIGEKNKQELIAKLEGTKNDISELQAKLQTKQKQVEQASKSKNQYLDEFRKLKSDYETVIRNLENTLVDMQGKLWKKEEANKQLRIQVVGMEELLVQIRSINGIGVTALQTQKVHHLNLLGHQKDNPPLLKTQPIPTTNPRKSATLEIEAGENEQRWKSLLQGIDSIAV